MTGPVKRVAVTGMGAVCCLGHDVGSVWEAAVAGRSGIGAIDAGGGPEGGLPAIGGRVRGFRPDPGLLPDRAGERYDRFIHFAVHAAAEALEQAGLSPGRDVPAERTGAVLGVGMGGVGHFEGNHASFLSRGRRGVSPFFVPAIIPSMASGLASLALGLRGANFTVSSACASGSHALAVAADEIRAGRHDAMVAGGAESALTGLVYGGFHNMRALARADGDPARASRPFDRGRTGFVMSEGAGVLVLEEMGRARARGARVLAELAGHGSTSDAHHATAPHPDGEGAARCMRLALEDAGADPARVGHINAHGTATPSGDPCEIRAVREVFGEGAAGIRVSSTKSMTGHLLGAAGGLESIFCVQALRTGVLPPTINLDDPDPGCGGVAHVAHEALEARTDYALNNSFGFGGTNCSVLFARAD